MKKLSLYFLFGLLSLPFACKGQTTQIAPNQHAIVIIADAVKSYDTIKLPDGGFLTNKAQISYITGNFQEEIIPLDYIGSSDTAIVDGNSLHTIIGIRYYDAEWLYIMCNGGDTIHIKYAEGFPVCYLANRKSLPYDINYQILKRKCFKQTEPLSIYYKMLNNLNGNLDYMSIYQSKYDDFVSENNFLDSIHGTGQISDTNYIFYKENLRYYFLCFNIGMQNAAIKMDAKLLKTDKADLQNEKMLPCSNYQWFLKYYVDNKLQYVKPKPIKGGQEFDSRILYDSVRKSSLFSPGIRNYLLLNYMQEICAKGSSSDIKLFFKKF